MKGKKISLYLLMVLVLIICCGNQVNAVNTGFVWGNQQGLTNKYLFGDGITNSHSYHQYILEGVGQAYCIQANVVYKTGKDYKVIGETIPEVSWLIKNVGDFQDRQAAIWMITGNGMLEGDRGFVEGLCTQAREGVKVRPANATISTSGNFRYDRATNSYISPNIHVEHGGAVTLSNAPASANITGGGNDYQIVIPAQDVTSDMDIGFNVAGAEKGTEYLNGTVWGDGVHQNVATGNWKDVTGASASASIHLTAVGDLRLEKYDEHGKVINGAQFRVIGPGVDEVITTQQDNLVKSMEMMQKME